MAQLLVQRCSGQVGRNIPNIQQQQQQQLFKVVSRLFRCLFCVVKIRTFSQPEQVISQTPLWTHRLQEQCVKLTDAQGCSYTVLRPFVPFLSTFPGKSKQRFGQGAQPHPIRRAAAWQSRCSRRHEKQTFKREKLRMQGSN